MKESLSITEQLTMRLLQELRNGCYQGCNRLPPEQDISNFFGVSRTVVRDALSTLEREGFIGRKRGVGTVINQHVLSVKTRIDMEEEFLDMIRDIGKTPSTKLIDIQECPADEQTAKQLWIPEGETVLAISRLICADEVPAIFCRDYIAKRRISDPHYDINVLENPIFDFIRKYCNGEVYMDVSEVRAVAATREIAKLLNVALAEPLLNITDVGYTFYGEPVLTSSEFYVDGIFHHTILRKKI